MSAMGFTAAIEAGDIKAILEALNHKVFNGMHHTEQCIKDNGDAITSALSVAARAKQNTLQICQLLVQSCPNVIKCIPDSFILHQIVEQPHRIIVANFLLPYGLQVNKICTSGGTPLHRAVSCGDLEMVEWLLQNGADVYIIANGMLPLNYIEDIKNLQKKNKIAEAFAKKMDPADPKYIQAVSILSKNSSSSLAVMLNNINDLRIKALEKQHSAHLARSLDLKKQLDTNMTAQQDKLGVVTASQNTMLSSQAQFQVSTTTRIDDVEKLFKSSSLEAQQKINAKQEQQYTTLTSLIEQHTKSSQNRIDLLETRLQEHQQKLEALRIEYQRKLAVIAASTPETLHKAVQSGDIETLKTLFPTSQQSLASPHMSSPMIEASGIDAKNAKEVSGIVSATSSLIKPTFDLKGISFIHLASFFQMQREHLRKLGAIFTIDELEQDTLTYISQPSTPDTQRYLRQMHSDLGLLLSQWREGILNNNDASEQLNRKATTLLETTCWPGGTTDFLEKCINPDLIKMANESLSELQWAEYQSWLKQTLDAQSATALQNSLTNGLWEWWKGSQEEGNPLASQLAANQETVFYRNLKEGKVAAEGLQYISQELKKRLALLSDPSCKLTPNDPLFPVSQVFWQTVHKILDEKKKKDENVYPSDMLKLYDDTIDGIIKQWQTGQLSEKIEASLEQVVSKIPKSHLLTGDFHTRISTEATIILLDQYRQSQSVLKQDNKVAKENAAQSNLPGPLTASTISSLEKCLAGLVKKMDPLPTQKQKTLTALLQQWKEKRLSSSVQLFLDSVIMKPWNMLLERMRQNFDPMARFAFLEQEITRLQTKLGLGAISTAHSSSLAYGAEAQPGMPSIVAFRSISNAAASSSTSTQDEKARLK